MAKEEVKNKGYYKTLFLIAGIYDFILGFAFLFFYKGIFNILGMNIPANPSYLTFGAFCIMFFGVLLFMISWKPEGSRRMIIYSVLFKFSYIVTVAYYFILDSSYVDSPFILFAFFDLVFAILFLESLRKIRN